MSSLRLFAGWGFALVLAVAPFSWACGGARGTTCAPDFARTPDGPPAREDARTRSVKDAHELAAALIQARSTLEELKQALKDGGRSLFVDRKFPTELGQALVSRNVDFGGERLANRSFSAVRAESMHDLIDFILRAQGLNDRKDLVVALLSKLKQPIIEELALPPGQSPIRHVVLLDDSVGTGGAFILPLQQPITPDDKNGVPTSLKFVNPKGGNSELPRLTDTKKIPSHGAVIPLVPASFERVCPSHRGQIAQLVATMNSLIDDIQGQKTLDASDYSRPGLSDLAQKLSDDLNGVN